MTEHDHALLERLRATTAGGVVEADEPAALARALVADGARQVPASAAAGWAGEAELLSRLADAVLAADEVVARARSHERSSRYAGAASSRRAGGPARVDTGGDVLAGVPASPAVRAAEAHRRRQVAAWKVAWWERGLPPAEVDRWVGAPGAGGPTATLVVVDGDGEVSDPVVETMVAAVPAAVRVLVVRGRAG